MNEECVHHWLVGAPVTRYSQPGLKGDLVEATNQRCKKCGATRLNEAVVHDFAGDIAKKGRGFGSASDYL